MAQHWSLLFVVRREIDGGVAGEFGGLGQRAKAFLCSTHHHYFWNTLDAITVVCATTVVSDAVF